MNCKGCICYSCDTDCTYLSCMDCQYCSEENSQEKKSCPHYVEEPDFST